MSIPGFGGPAEPGAGQQTTGRPQRGVLHSVQAGLKVPSLVTGCVRGNAPGRGCAGDAGQPAGAGWLPYRVAEALLTLYNLPEQAAAFFRFFAQAGGPRRRCEMTCS